MKMITKNDIFDERGYLNKNLKFNNIEIFYSKPQADGFRFYVERLNIVGYLPSIALYGRTDINKGFPNREMNTPGFVLTDLRVQDIKKLAEQFSAIKY